MIPLTLLYIGATGGTIGTTQKTGVLMGAQIRVKTGLVPVPVGDGSEPQHLQVDQARNHLLVDLGWRRTARRQWRQGALARTNKTVRLIRLSNTGSGNKGFTIDFAGIHDSVGDYTTANRQHDVCRSRDSTAYGPADTLFWSMTVVKPGGGLP